MTDDKQTAFIQEFAASGVELREWDSDGCRFRLVQIGIDFCEQVYDDERDDWLIWRMVLGERHIANEILRQLTEDCDEAGLNVRLWPGGFCVTKPDRMQNLHVYEWEVKEHDMGGYLTGKTHLETRYAFVGGETTTFTSRAEAMLVAVVAVEKEKRA